MGAPRGHRHRGRAIQFGPRVLRPAGVAAENSPYVFFVRGAAAISALNWTAVRTHLACMYIYMYTTEDAQAILNRRRQEKSSRCS